MAVPSAVLKQRAKLEKELGINPDGSPIVTDPAALASAAQVDPAQQTPQQDPAVVVVDPPVDLAARNQELEHLLRTRDGQTSAAMREANDAKVQVQTQAVQIAALEEAVANLTSTNTTVTAQLAAKAADADMPTLDDVGDATPAEIESFGADSVKFVEKLSKKELLRYIKPLIAKMNTMETRLARLPELDRLPQIEKVVNQAQTDAARAKEAEFFRKEILAYFPDFETVRNSQGWKDYLATDIPGAGIKIGHQLTQYRNVSNAPGLRAIVNGYYEIVKAKPSLASLAVPAKTSTEGSPVVKPRLKASEYQAKLKQFTGRSLAKDEWDAFKTEFNTALAEDRVDMDVRL